MTTSWQLIDGTRERGCTLYNWFQLILVHTVFQFALFYKLHLHDALIRANISSMCHVSGLSHHGVSSTLQCNFTLRITHGAPLTTRFVFLAMLYLTVVTPVSLSLWNDTWKDNMNTNKEFQDFKSKEWKFRSGWYLITNEDLTSTA